MKKIICDFCKINEAVEHYRIEKFVEVTKFDFGTVFTDTQWVRKDICEECFNKLFKGGKEWD